MTLNYANMAKQVIGLVGLLVAGTLVSLPASAQVSPAESPEMTTEEAIESPDLTVPTEVIEPIAPEEASDIPEAVDSAEETLSPEVDETEVTETETTEETPEVIGEEVPAEPTAEMESTEEPAEAELPATEPTTEAETPGSPNLAAASGTIVDVASSSETFQTLVAALTEAELAEVLQGEGPFTVFAPTDEAFAALPEGTLDELLKPENRDTLVQILTYHVVPGAVTSDALSSGDVETLEGSSVAVTVDQGAVTVNDATVVQADIPATNGVIHAIDQVILPPSLQ
ncbi:MAG: hypothetical protein Kow00121_10270 [Elainellaceae cyanobacterium]